MDIGKAMKISLMPFELELLCDIEVHYPDSTIGRESKKTIPKGTILKGVSRNGSGLPESKSVSKKVQSRRKAVPKVRKNVRQLG